MAGSVNKVILVGNLGSDPDVRVMQSGDKVVNMSIATSESWKDRNTGERKDRTQWHRVVVFNQGLAKVCENYLRKGSKVYIEGQLETRKWTDQNGVEKYSTEVVLRPYRGELTMLDARGGDAAGYGGGSGASPFQDNGSSGFGDPQQQGQGYGQGQQAQAQSAASAPMVEEFEDDIPF